MKTKQIIFIIVIIVALGVAGFFFYKAFFAKPTGSRKPVSINTPPVLVKNTNSSSSTSTSSTNSSSAPAKSSSAGSSVAKGTILPHGNDLDFSLVKKYNSSGKLYPYPKVTPEETGQPLNDIISTSK